jgi:hypothetical protein
MHESERSGFSAPDAPPPLEVLAALLGEVLEPLVTEHGDEALETSAAVLRQACTIICDEIYTVALPNRAERRARRRRRPT